MKALIPVCGNYRRNYTFPDISRRFRRACKTVFYMFAFGLQDFWKRCLYTVNIRISLPHVRGLVRPYRHIECIVRATNTAGVDGPFLITRLSIPKSTCERVTIHYSVRIYTSTRDTSVNTSQRQKAARSHTSVWRVELQDGWHVSDHRVRPLRLYRPRNSIYRANI